MIRPRLCLLTLSLGAVELCVDLLGGDLFDFVLLEAVLRVSTKPCTALRLVLPRGRTR